MYDNEIFNGIDNKIMIGSGTVLQQRYKIERQIGQGGMGAVYVSTDERFGSTVAIKETLCNDDNFRKALEREARLLNSLKHTALPRVTDHFEENEGLFIVMEYIPGDDLSVVLERENAPFPVETVYDWAMQLLDALDFLHTQEIPVVHRDIKPQNLKLTPRGQIILLDFGLAKGNPTDAGHQTAAKSIFGYSRNYASLEQIQGTGTDPRSDLYSLAATIYHLLTGVAPEDALTRAMAVLSQRADPLVAANSLRSDVPAGFAGVLQKALDLNADMRPSSAREMRAMLSDSDAYAHLAPPQVGNAAQSSSQSGDAQNTKIMPEGTQAEGIRFTDLKTEVMIDGMSRVTTVKPSVLTNEQSASRRAPAFAVGLIGVVLAGGLIAGGLYLAKPEIFSAAPATRGADSPAAANVAANSVDNAPSLVDGQSAVISNSNSATAVDTPTVKPSAGDSSQKLGTQAKTDATSAKSKDPANGETVITGTDDDGSPVTVRRSADGRTTTIISPEGTIVTRDGNLVTRRPPPPQPGRQPVVPPPGFDPSKLTPEQRRKLRVLMRDPRFNPQPDPLKP